jgi:hypothetical protein
MSTDFFHSSLGHVSSAGWRRYRPLLSIIDFAHDWRLAQKKETVKKAISIPPQKVLMAGVEVPGRERDLQLAIELLSASAIHHTKCSIADMGQRGKFDNINNALANEQLSDCDWVLIVDDDVALPESFLDLFLYYCVQNDLKLAMPAHRILSHKTFAITERNWASTVRLTNFVEIGPITILHRDTFSSLIPFPSLRYGWGLDVLWSSIAISKGWRIGVVDATPVRHLRPIAGSYSGLEARKEAEAFLTEHGVTLTKAAIMEKNIRL